MSQSVQVRFLDRTSAPHITTLILLSGLTALSMNVFLPSLPGMTEHFETDYRLMQLSLALYLGMNGILQIFIGPLSDQAGRRPVILWGIALFLLATLGCIFAPSIEIFLFFRMCQAAIAVGIALARAAVRDMYDTDRAASMIGYVTMGMAVVPMIGPAIGGALDGVFGWQSNFWLLFSLGALLFALVWSDFGETARVSGKTLREQFREYPELLTSPRFWGYVVCAGCASGTFFAYLGGAPFVGSEFYHMEPKELGIFFGAPAVGYFFGNFLSGRYSTRVGINQMIFWGSVLCAIGPALSLMLLYGGVGSKYTFFGMMTLIGLGNGLSMPNATAGSLSVRPHLAGTASGLGGAILLLEGAVLSALAGWLLTSQTGAFPLLWLQLIISVAGIAAIAYVIRRERHLARQ